MTEHICVRCTGRRGEEATFTLGCGMELPFCPYCGHVEYVMTPMEYEEDWE